MDHQTLRTFRKQLYTWIESRLETGRYPFRRVEKNPEIICASGIESPDLVLWINRDSCLAGGIILLPPRHAPSCIQRGADIAAALGLTNFVLWNAHEVTLWRTRQQAIEQLATLELAPVQKLSACDFERMLDQLLARLKLLAVTGTAETNALPAHYFANLCKITLQNVLPGQTVANRMTAAGSFPDSWVAKITDQKIWLTLWRLLFLLERDRLPPSLQPNRLEHAMSYAMAALAEEEVCRCFLSEPTEPALTEEASIGFHQLANRLQQLGWPLETNRTASTIKVLLENSETTFGISSAPAPWAPGVTDLAVNYALPVEYANCRLVAPKVYLAGWNLLAHLSSRAPTGQQAGTVYEMRCSSPPVHIVAHLQDSSIPSSAERGRRLMGLREVWPHHRFNIPWEMPSWSWDALHLAGQAAPDANFQLCVPADWHYAPGANLAWTYLLKRLQLLVYAQTGDGHFLLRFGKPDEDESFYVSRHDGQVRIARDLVSVWTPGLLHVCLMCDTEILRLFLDGCLRPYPAGNEHGPDKVVEAAWLFYHSTPGRHIWRYQAGNRPLPEFDQFANTLCVLKALLPAPDVLRAFILLDWTPGEKVPERERLDRVLRACWENIPELSIVEPATSRNKTRRHNQQKVRREIADLVFRDGVPRFPEHYLMRHYRPALRSYEIPGPLEYLNSFFGRVSLRAPDGSEIVLDDEQTAKALLLVSHANRQTVQLPAEASLTEQILNQYLADLETLWATLLGECRRRIPLRQQALSAARRIWKGKNLPTHD
jgi:hypothetical protein